MNLLHRAHLHLPMPSFPQLIHKISISICFPSSSLLPPFQLPPCSWPALRFCAWPPLSPCIFLRCMSLVWSPAQHRVSSLLTKLHLCILVQVAGSRQLRKFQNLHVLASLLKWRHLIDGSLFLHVIFTFRMSPFAAQIVPLGPAGHRRRFLGLFLFLFRLLFRLCLRSLLEVHLSPGDLPC